MSTSATAFRFYYMHISNMYMSEPRYYNHGINVLGPQVFLKSGSFSRADQ